MQVRTIMVHLHLKGIVQFEMKNLSLFTHLHIIPKLWLTFFCERLRKVSNVFVNAVELLGLQICWIPSVLHNCNCSVFLSHSFVAKDFPEVFNQV